MVDLTTTVQKETEQICAEAAKVLHAGPPDSGGPSGILFRRGG